MRLTLATLALFAIGCNGKDSDTGADNAVQISDLSAAASEQIATVIP